jgi:hypothetical protein
LWNRWEFKELYKISHNQYHFIMICVAGRLGE